MVYKKDKPLALKGSTSALCNNLSILVNLPKGVINYAVVHKSVVNLISAATDGSTANHRQVVCKEPSSTHSNTFVLQARLLPMATRTVLVIASQRGIQMFEADGSLMLYWYALGDVDQNESLCFGQGICNPDKNTICVGNHEGGILVFDIPDKSTNITLSETLRGHNAAICALEADSGCMVSSDSVGNITLWKSADDTFRPTMKIAGDGLPCSSVSLWNNLVIGGYGSGHIRVYNATTGKLGAEATAHAKWITAIDVAKNSGLLLSASEDCFARVWQLTSGDSPTLELTHSELVTDMQLQGAKFISDDGRAFACTGYDSNEILFYTQS